MSDKWEVKEARQDGDSWWVKVGPKADTDNGTALLVCAVVIGLSLMHLFGVVGVGWFFFMSAVALLFSVFFTGFALLITLIIVGFFIFS